MTRPNEVDINPSAPQDNESESTGGQVRNQIACTSGIRHLPLAVNRSRIKTWPTGSDDRGDHVAAVRTMKSLPRFHSE